MTSKRPIRRSEPDVPGDFYVEDGCCLSCGMPHEEAPTLFEWLPFDGAGCYVKRQPQTAVEVSQMLRAMTASEVDCIRYAGDDPTLQRRIVAFGGRAFCDLPAPADAPERRIRRVTTLGGDPKAAIVAMRTGIRSKPEHYRIAHSLFGNGSQSVRYAWWENHFQTVAAAVSPDGPGRILISMRADPPNALLAVNRHVDEWLSASGLFTDFRWWTDEEWDAGEGWTATPI